MPYNQEFERVPNTEVEDGIPQRIVIPRGVIIN
jgi:hypothetical protein